MSEPRIYHVTAPGGDKLVKAKTQAAAINHVIRASVTAKPVSATALLELQAKGIKVEDATATEATAEAAPNPPTPTEGD
jgi:hypothetical protein